MRCSKRFMTQKSATFEAGDDDDGDRAGGVAHHSNKQ